MALFQPRGLSASASPETLQALQILTCTPAHPCQDLCLQRRLPPPHVHWHCPRQPRLTLTLSSPARPPARGERVHSYDTPQEGTQWSVEPQHRALWSQTGPPTMHVLPVLVHLSMVTLTSALCAPGLQRAFVQRVNEAGGSLHPLRGWAGKGWRTRPHGFGWDSQDWIPRMAPHSLQVPPHLPRHSNSCLKTPPLLEGRRQKTRFWVGRESREEC